MDRNTEAQSQRGNPGSVLSCSLLYESGLPPNSSYLAVPCAQKETIGDLTILNAQLRHGGKYTCMAQTVVDGTSKEATVLVRGNGSQPPSSQGGSRLPFSPHLSPLPES